MEKQSLSVKAVFDRALEIEAAADRQAYLDEVCAEAPELRQKVEALLKAYEDAGSFLEKPAPGLDATVNSQPGQLADKDSLGPSNGKAPGLQSISESPGTVIGPYKLLQQIGEGGMGTVFLAEQTQPVQRKVALKVIKPGMDSRQVIARFEAERQALAMMDHVNIARVLDAGATEAGRPYFVMELVHGVPITQYCDDNRLTPRQRLELFVPVCQAIQHAHQKGIIHRDVKPSNVMITLYDGKPVPKVIDFGVAKATEQRLTERTLFTQDGTMVGTLEYMSPEQAEMSALGVDTRSDIYSLGVLLYELLTGSTPLSHKRIKEAAYAEILRMIKEEEPPKPSTRLSDSGAMLASISAQRHMEPAKLTKLVRGELDWIVMKTLEKDRNRRYVTANGLALDIQRYLEDETVQACPPSAWYRFRKFARRNKRALAFASCLLLMLAVVAGSVGWVTRDREARREEGEREHSARAAEIEREVNRAVADAQQLQGQSKWPEALAAAQRARGLLAGIEISTELRQRIDDLESDLVTVLRLEEIHGRPVLPDYITGQEQDAGYAKVFRDSGIDIEALEPGAAAERIRARSIRQQLAMTLDGWAGLRKRKAGDQSWKKLVEIARAADPDEWRTRFRDALLRGDRQGLERLAESVPIKQLSPGTLLLLGNALNEVGAPDKGMALLRDAQQQYPGDLWLNDTLAAISLWGQPPRCDDALRYYAAALAVRPDNYRLHDMVGKTLHQQKSLNAAVAAFSRAIELKPDYWGARWERGEIYLGLGQADKALADYSYVIDRNPKDVWAWYNRGCAYRGLKQWDKAIADFSKAIELDPNLAVAWNNRGGANSKLKQWDKAIAAFRAAIRLDPKNAVPHNNLGNALYKQNKLDDAVAAFRRAIQVAPKYAEPHNGLGAVLSKQNKLDDAAAAYRQAIQLDPKNVVVHLNLGFALKQQNKLGDAAAAYRQAIQLDPKSALAHNNLGVVLDKQNKLDEAIEAYRLAIRAKPEYAMAHCNLGLALKKQGYFTEALVALRRGHELGSREQGWSYPSAQWVRDCERLVELDKKLAKALRSEAKAATTSEQIEFAVICQMKARRLYGSSVRFYEEAFRAQPELENPQRFYNAARAAALAGDGQGKDEPVPDEQARVRWRKQALNWLRADLVWLAKQLKNPSAEGRAVARQTLEHWKRDPDLASLRDAKPLANLSEAEREVCCRLWAEVDSLLEQATRDAPS